MPELSELWLFKGGGLRPLELEIVAAVVGKGYGSVEFWMVHVEVGGVVGVVRD